MHARHLLLPYLAATVVTACTDATAPGASLNLSADSVVVLLDSSVHLTAVVTGVSSQVAWYSFDTTVAKVVGGIVTGVALGTTEIVAAADTLSVRIPVRVVTPFAGVAVGEWISCALGADLRAYCWGFNTGATPRLVDSVTRFTQLAANWTTACGRTSAGQMLCWGGSTTTFQLVSVTAPPFVRVFGSRSYMCGLTNAKAVLCWGGYIPASRPLGTPQPVGTTANPIEPLIGAAFASFTTGPAHACGTTTAGATYCWGLNELGQGGNSQSNTSCGGDACNAEAIQVAGVPPFTSMAAHWYHTCGLTAQGDAWCWGANDLGQLGDTTSTDCIRRRNGQPYIQCRETPMPVQGGHHFASIVVGINHTCGLKADGTLWCWGYNGEGQFGLGTVDSIAHPAPVRAAPGLTFSSVSSYDSTVCGMASDGRLYCWGDDWFNQLANGPQQNKDGATPRPIPSQP